MYTDEDDPKEWNDALKQTRSLIECVIADVKKWKVADCRFKGSVKMHCLSLFAIYQIVAWKIKNNQTRRNFSQESRNFPHSGH